MQVAVQLFQVGEAKVQVVGGRSNPTATKAPITRQTTGGSLNAAHQQTKESKTHHEISDHETPVTNWPSMAMKWSTGQVE